MKQAYSIFDSEDLDHPIIIKGDVKNKIRFNDFDFILLTNVVFLSQEYSWDKHDLYVREVFVDIESAKKGLIDHINNKHKQSMRKIDNYLKSI